MFWDARVLHWCIQQVFGRALNGWVTCNMSRDGGGLLQLLILNEEFLVSRSHQLGLITSLPFVHTARRSYRLSDPVNYLDCSKGQCVSFVWEMSWTLSLRGRRSRNKVSVGEPAEGSFVFSIIVCVSCGLVFNAFVLNIWNGVLWGACMRWCLNALAAVCKVCVVYRHK